MARTTGSNFAQLDANFGTGAKAAADPSPAKPRYSTPSRVLGAGLIAASALQPITLDSVRAQTLAKGISLPASGVSFTDDECIVLKRFLVGEITDYKDPPNKPEMRMSSTLPASTRAFLALNKPGENCFGPAIQYSTIGDKNLLDGAVLKLSLLESRGSVPQGITNKFRAVVAKNPVAEAPGQKTSSATPTVLQR
jgi:hypothetical protein